MTKIIHILSRSPASPAYRAKASDENPTLGSSNPDDFQYYDRVEGYPHWIGYFQNDWHVQIARETLKVSNKYRIECWRPYCGTKKIYKKKINNITHVLFPSIKFQIGKNYLGEISPKLIKHLKREITDRKVIIHTHAINSLFGIMLLSLRNLYRIPVIGQHHGNSVNWPRLFRLPFIKYLFPPSIFLNKLDYLLVLNSDIILLS